jgi:hypothetical protein
MELCCLSRTPTARLLDNYCADAHSGTLLNELNFLCRAAPLNYVCAGDVGDCGSGRLAIESPKGSKTSITHAGRGAAGDSPAREARSAENWLIVAAIRAGKYQHCLCTL